MNDAHTALHVGFGRETFATFAGDFEIGFMLVVDVVCHTASGFWLRLNHRRTRGDEMMDGQGMPRNYLAS